MTQLATRGETWPLACFETRQDQTQEGREGGRQREREKKGEQEESVHRAEFSLLFCTTHCSKTVAGNPTVHVWGIFGFTADRAKQVWNKVQRLINLCLFLMHKQVIQAILMLVQELKRYWRSKC